jgi:anti-anti-sigma factor
MAGLTIRSEGEVFYLAGEFDLAEVDGFDEVTAVALNRNDPVVLDLTELTFIDASGLRAVVRLALCVKGDFHIRNPQPHVMKVIEIMGVADLPGMKIETL